MQEKKKERQEPLKGKSYPRKDVSNEKQLRQQKKQQKNKLGLKLVKMMKRITRMNLKEKKMRLKINQQEVDVVVEVTNTRKWYIAEKTSQAHLTRHLKMKHML